MKAIYELFLFKILIGLKYNSENQFCLFSQYIKLPYRNNPTKIYYIFNKFFYLFSNIDCSNVDLLLLKLVKNSFKVFFNYSDFNNDNILSSTTF